ncbi:hypothetical protein WMY93_007946 [Mugilogobius chulae]|uniref:ribonuclease H n=1 Tax=Mugilogobius chulae TaxID=88201 RepID=A0AAW0PEP4_9GOBI
MSEEYEYSDKEKRRRIVESLKGPALEIIQAVRLSNSEATHIDYLQALESTFGTSESGEELYLKFRALHQTQGECLSDFLLRLERTLNKVVQRGGLLVSETNRARIEQLLKGATESDIMLLQLNLRERRGNPPSFLDLLKEIREEEEREAARQKFKKPSRQFVRSVQTTETDSDNSQPTDLKAEVQELKAKLKTLNKQSNEQKKGSKERKRDKPDKGDEVKQLRQEPISSLAIWGLSAESYPYCGYVVVEMEFPEDVAGVKGPITVLALICPEPPQGHETPVVVGTNAFLFRRLFQLCKENGSEVKVSSMRIQAVYDQIQAQPSQSHAEDTAIEQKTTKPQDIVLIEAPAMSQLPSGVLVQPGVLPESDINENSFKVLVHNESEKPTCIQVGTVIAEMHAVDVVTNPQTLESHVQVLDPNLFDFGDSPVPEEWKNRLRQKLAERRNVFSLDEWDVGLAKDVEHKIRLSDSTPFRERSRRLAPADIDDVRRHLQQLLEAGILKESRSPYASPIVVVRKKNGSIRICIDYRTLNSRTIPDQYTIPRIDDALDCLTGSKWFSVLDLRSGYYQIAMSEEDKEKTAFICPLGFYQFERMPQGITGAPATFQRLMEKAVGDMHLLQVIVYLDDIIVFGKTLEEHEQRLLKVLDRLEEYGLKVSIDKCQFCQSQVKYVGHIVSEAGIATDPEKVAVVKNWPEPTDLKSLRSFLGFCGYYRRFIASYSTIVRPLTELTKGYPPTQNKNKVKDPTKTYLKPSEPFKERWDESCRKAFRKIIDCLTNAPVLAFADPTKPYVLHVDASMNGLGAVLNQEYTEGLKPVAFASRKLSESERNYPVHQT